MPSLHFLNYTSKIIIILSYLSLIHKIYLFFRINQFVRERKNLEDDLKYYKKVNEDLLRDIKGLRHFHKERADNEKKKLTIL